MVVTIKKPGIADLEVHGAVSKFEVHFHDVSTVAGGASGFSMILQTPVVSLLKCDGEWLHIAQIEKLIVEET